MSEQFRSRESAQLPDTLQTDTSQILQTLLTEMARLDVNNTAAETDTRLAQMLDNAWDVLNEQNRKDWLTKLAVSQNLLTALGICPSDFGTDDTSIPNNDWNPVFDKATQWVEKGGQHPYALLSSVLTKALSAEYEIVPNGQFTLALLTRWESLSELAIKLADKSESLEQKVLSRYRAAVSYRYAFALPAEKQRANDKAAILSEDKTLDYRKRGMDHIQTAMEILLKYPNFNINSDSFTADSSIKVIVAQAGDLSPQNRLLLTKMITMWGELYGREGLRMAQATGGLSEYLIRRTRTSVAAITLLNQMLDFPGAARQKEIIQRNGWTFVRDHLLKYTSSLTIPTETVKEVLDFAEAAVREAFGDDTEKLEQINELRANLT